MISIESEGKAVSINIILDNEGVEELIGYLNYIREKDESLHLSMGNELEENVFTKEYFSIHHAKLIFVDSKSP